MLGTFESHPLLAIVATTGVIFAAYYMLPMVQKIFFNPLSKAENREIPDLSRREVAILSPLLGLMIFIGVYPTPFLERMQPSVDSVLEIVSSARPDQAVRDLGVLQLGDFALSEIGPVQDPATADVRGSQTEVVEVDE